MHRLGVERLSAFSVYERRIMSKTVIDLSKFNSVENWPKVKAAVDAVVLRLGYRGAHTGTITYDPKYLEYMAACQKHGIPVMIYFFPCSISTAEAEAEANFIISAAKKVKLAGPIWLDSEVVYQDRSGRADKLSKADRTKYLNVILKALRTAGYDCGVYASTSWFKNCLNDSDLVDCRRWVADWASKCSYTTFEYAMWQYTSKGSIPGINGNVDISECYLHLDASGQMEAVKAGATRQDVVDQICSWEGYSEANGKHKLIVDIYNYYLPTAVKTGTLNYKVTYHDAWCNTASSAAFIQAGCPELIPIECGCPRSIALAKKMGIWQEADDYVPNLADLVLYDWQDTGSGDNQGTPDHIGIVISVDKAAGTFVVMEGNTGNGVVGRRNMKINGKYIRGFITPRFSTSTNAKTVEKKAAVTISASAKSSGGYEISGTGTPSKKVVKTGLLKKNQKVTARRQPIVSGTPCSFSPVSGLTRIDVCDYIMDKTGTKWAYCRVNGLYGYILYTSIRDYLRTGGQDIAKVAEWVIADDFGKNATRENVLKALGYDADAVQKAVNDKLGYKASEKSDSPRIRVWPVWFFEKDEGQFGDCTAIIEYAADNKTVAHCVLIDTAKATAASVVISKLQKAGVKRIDAVVISHAHGDHYGGLNNIMSKIPVGHIYVPDTAGLDKYQKSYASAIRSQAKKAPSTTLKAGSAFQIGSIKCQCIYQVPADKLKEHDNHHFVNNQSVVLRFTLGDWTYHTAGDLQNEGNNVLVKAVSNLQADIYKTQWHGDANACNETICKAVRPKIAFSNYHHKEGSGRGTTRKRLEAVGAVVARNSENGDIYIDCQGETMKLSCSKGNLSRTFVKKN